MPKRTPPESPADLAALQRRMAAAVMRPLTADHAMQPRWTDGRATGEVVAAFIKPSGRLTSFERLEIYNRQYWFRLLDCLRDDYPGLRAVLGEKRFMALITAYLERHPSRSPLLRGLGSRLVEFLDAEPSWCRPHRRLARDMARLEWAQIVAFDGAAKPRISPRKLAATPPDRLRFQLQPYVSLLDLAYPVDEVVLRVLRQDSKLRSEASNAVDISSRPVRRSIAGRVPRKRVWLAVHRAENSVYFKRLTETQFRLLQSLDRGTSLAEALDGIAASPAKITANEIREWFRHWAQLGFFTQSRGWTTPL